MSVSKLLEQNVIEKKKKISSKQETYINFKLLPLWICVQWVSFWIKPEAAPARVTLGVTSLLTLSTQHAKSQASLPPVSYLKAVDAFMSVCTVFVFMALMEYCLVNIVLGDSDTPPKPAPPPPPPSSSGPDSAKLDKIFDIATKVTPGWTSERFRQLLCLGEREWESKEMDKKGKKREFQNVKYSHNLLFESTFRIRLLNLGLKFLFFFEHCIVCE